MARFTFKTAPHQFDTSLTLRAVSILVFDVRRGDSNNATTAKQSAKTISEPKQA